MTLKSAMSVAEHLAKDHGTRDPYRLARALGVSIRYSNLGDGYLGYSNTIHRIPIIVLNENNTDDQNHAVSCHELGHCVIHPHENTNFFTRVAPLMTRGIEAEANAFMAELVFGGVEINPMDYSTILDRFGLPQWIAEYIDEVQRDHLWTEK